MDLGIVGEGLDEHVESKNQGTSEDDPDKIEIPQDIIDQISDNENTDEQSGSADTEETAN